MEQLKRGRHKRLLRKFSAFQEQRSRAEWMAIAILAFSTVLCFVVLQLIRPPALLFLVLLFGTLFGSMVANSIWFKSRCRAIAQNLGLICSRCSRPLPDIRFFRPHEHQPPPEIHRPPPIVPSVCPHCKLAMNEAARPSGQAEQ